MYDIGIPGKLLGKNDKTINSIHCQHILSQHAAETENRAWKIKFILKISYLNGCLIRNSTN